MYTGLYLQYSLEKNHMTFAVLENDWNISLTFSEDRLHHQHYSRKTLHTHQTKLCNFVC